MLLRIGWVFIGAEVVIALVCGLVLWYFWSHSAMSRSAALKATLVFAVGCVLIIFLALVLPL